MSKLIHAYAAEKAGGELKAFSFDPGELRPDGGEIVESCGIRPQVEYFPLARVNDKLEHLRAGQARYRIVLQA